MIKTPHLSWVVALFAASTFAAGQTLDSIQHHFEDLMADPPQAEASINSMEMLLAPIETAPAGDVANLLLSITRASAHENIYVQMEGVSALFYISVKRPDHVQLLTPHLEVMRTLLNQQDPRLADMGLMLLGSLTPSPPAAVVPMLLDFSKRTDANTVRQASALWAALERSPHDAGVIEAVLSFASRNLDVASRIRIMDGLGALGVTDPRLLSIIEDAMRHSDPAIRTRSLDKLMQLGPAQLRKHALEIERLRTQDPDAETRSRADKALRVMGGESQFPQ